MLNKITGYGPVRPGSGAKGKQSVSGTSSFADILSAATEETSASVPISATNPVGNMLALQEVTDEEVRRKRLVRQGHDMLDVLETLRRKLLEGSIPADMLQALERQLSAQKQNVMDPALRELIDDIELRLAVELAKLENALPKDVR
jgi:hypothetical protein